MLAHCKELMEYQKGFMAIHPRFNKLLTALRTAVENGDIGCQFLFLIKKRKRCLKSTTSY
jgi:hypothetical protein